MRTLALGRPLTSGSALQRYFQSWGYADIARTVEMCGCNFVTPRFSAAASAATAPASLAMLAAMPRAFVLPALVLNVEARVVVLLDQPGRREAAGRHCQVVRFVMGITSDSRGICSLAKDKEPPERPAA
jgi:hypothetical protein